MPWKSTVLWRSRLQTSILEPGTETFPRPNAPDKQKGFPSLVKIRRGRLHFQKLWGCLVHVSMSVCPFLTEIVGFSMQKCYQTDSLFEWVPPIFGGCCLTQLEWPSPHDCTSSVWDELVFISVVEPPTVRKAASKELFAHPPTVNLFFTSYYPCHPTTPFTHLPHSFCNGKTYSSSWLNFSNYIFLK
jgi:hypothetical protein